MKERPLIVGITGGIGSGKSTVCRIFSALGAPVYEADARAKAILDEDKALQADIVREFGKDILGTGRRIDRRKLAARVFLNSNREPLNKLNSLVHPAVFADTVRWVDAHAGAAYVIKEAAILFESGAYHGVHVKVMVSAPEEIRIARVMIRDRSTREDVLARMANQWPEEKKVAMSDHVIRNDGGSPILPQVLKLHSKWSRE